MKTLYILRGIPGSGKSTLAAQLVGETNYFEADMYHYVKQDDGTTKYDFKIENLRKAHQWCFATVESKLRKGTEQVAVSNTFTRFKEFKEYIELAKKYGYRYSVITVENYHGGENSHNVPEETLQKMENRYDLRLRNKTVKVNQ